jgi:hypothetical protein
MNESNQIESNQATQNLTNHSYLQYTYISLVWLSFPTSCNRSVDEALKLVAVTWSSSLCDDDNGLAFACAFACAVTSSRIQSPIFVVINIFRACARFQAFSTTIVVALQDLPNPFVDCLFRANQIVRNGT